MHQFPLIIIRPLLDAFLCVSQSQCFVQRSSWFRILKDAFNFVPSTCERNMYSTLRCSSNKSVLMRSTRRPHLLLVVSIDRYYVFQSLVMASLCLFPIRVRSVGLLMEFQLYSILFELLLLRFFLYMLKILFLTCCRNKIL